MYLQQKQLFSRIREHHKTKERLEVDDAKEGEELQKLALQHKLEKEHLENIRKDEKQQLMLDNRKQIGERAALKKLQENQEDVRFLSLYTVVYRSIDQDF